MPLDLLADRVTEGDAALQEERRLFYVGMTRARDELVLTHAADYGGSRARRVSPFVLEALDLPTAAGVPGVGARRPAPIEQLGAFEIRPAAAEAPLGPTNEPLTLSFGQIDDYLTCPAKYKYQHVLRVPVAPHHAMIYGSALHKAVQEFHRRHARGDVMSEAELIDSFEVAWRNEGFLTRQHEEARLEAGRAALRRFRAEQLQPGRRGPGVRRARVLVLAQRRQDPRPLGSGRHRGSGRRHAGASSSSSRQWRSVGSSVATGVTAIQPDVVSDTLPLMPRERVTITDYKSSDVRDPAMARQRARESLQLTIYAMGYQALTGRLPDAVQLQFLESGVIGRADVDDRRVVRGQAQIAQAATGIRARNFTARPDPMACSYCPFRDICPASVAR